MLQNLPVDVKHGSFADDYSALFCEFFKAKVYDSKRKLIAGEITEPTSPVVIATHFSFMQINSGVSWAEFQKVVYRRLIRDKEFGPFYTNNMRIVDFMLELIF
jgi:hypothetical protein